MGIGVLNKLVIILMIFLGAYLIIYHDKLGRETAESLKNKILPLKKATPKEKEKTDQGSGRNIQQD